MVDRLQRGITLDGKRTLPCEIEQMKTTGRNVDEGNSWYEVKLREGRTQQIRKMFKAIGHPVIEAAPRRDRTDLRSEADAGRVARADEAGSETAVDADGAEGGAEAAARTTHTTRARENGLEEEAGQRRRPPRSGERRPASRRERVPHAAVEARRSR